MSHHLWNILQSPEVAPAYQDTALRKRYRYWRIRAFYAVFIGYALFYVTRSNIAVAVPKLLEDLHLSKTEIGVVFSVFNIVYAIAKFSSGVLTDKVNLRYFMAFGLFGTAMANLAFALSPQMVHGFAALGVVVSPITLFAIFWSINGLMQSVGSPIGPKVMAQWFSVSERGTKYAIYNTCHNVGAFAIMALGGWLVAHWGWQAGFQVPAAIAVLGSLFVLSRLPENPENVGLPPIAAYHQEVQSDLSAVAPIAETAATEALPAVAWRYVFSNYRLWLLAFSSLFVYVIRYGLMNWAPTYLVEVKGANLQVAGLSSSTIELLGIPGGILAGMATDKYFSGRRIPVAAICLVCVALAATAFYYVPPGHPWLDAVAIGLCGFFTYGPQMLIPGLAAVDFATRRAAGTAVGLTGAFSYLGATITGVGSGYLVDHFGWAGGFYLWVGSAMIALLFILPLWSAQARAD